MTEDRRKELAADRMDNVTVPLAGSGEVGRGAYLLAMGSLLGRPSVVRRQVSRGGASTSAFGTW